jgi:hypothetical protein
MDRLDTLQLNRATLARQLLLRPAARPARDAIAHLAGLQAQAPLAPYVGLWTRLSGFGHQDLTDLLTERSVVRAHLMRNTVHLVTAADFLSFRPLFQPLMQRAPGRAPPPAPCSSKASGPGSGRSPAAGIRPSWRSVPTSRSPRRARTR